MKKDRAPRKPFLALALAALIAAVVLLSLLGCEGFGDDREEANRTMRPFFTESPKATAGTQTSAPGNETAAPADETSAPEEDVEGVEIVSAQWVEGEGDSAEIRITARIPKKNRDKGMTMGDFYAFINDPDAPIESWHGIMTPSDADTQYYESESGDLFVYFRGFFYWPDRKPQKGDKLTFAATGLLNGKETGLSNRITVEFGQIVNK